MQVVKNLWMIASCIKIILMLILNLINIKKKVFLEIAYNTMETNQR